jgi:hypothetical protein
VAQFYNLAAKDVKVVLQDVPGPDHYNIVMDKGWLLVSVVVPQQRLCSRPTIELDGNVIINRWYGFGRRWIYPVPTYSPRVSHGLRETFVAIASAEI